MGRRLWVILIRTLISRISNFSFPLCSPTLKNQTENARRRWYHVGHGSCVWHLYSSVWQCTQWQVRHHDLPLQGSRYLRAGVPAAQHMCHAVRPLGRGHWEAFDSWFLPQWCIALRCAGLITPALPRSSPSLPRRVSFSDKLTALEEASPCPEAHAPPGASLWALILSWFRKVCMCLFSFSRSVTNLVFWLLFGEQALIITRS